MKLTGAFLIVCGFLSAQEPRNQNAENASVAAGAMPVFRASVTSGTTKAVSYQHRSGPTEIDFQGTTLLAGSRGRARVESKQGVISIEANFEGLRAASTNGAEYLTYVLWAVTPEGRTANLGEVLLDGTKSKLHATTELQVFGLIVTAEPYFAVTQPSDLIVLENMIRPDTRGKVEEIDAKYELLKRGRYQELSNPLDLKTDRKLPLELYEARNAVHIARAMGADTYATDTFRKAEKSLAEAEAYQNRNAGSKPVTMTARATVQTAEDARAIAVKRQEDDAVTAEHQGLVDREKRAESATATAQSETERVSRDAEAARLKAQAEAARLTREKDAQAASSREEANRLKLENDSQRNAATLEAARLKQENDANMATAQAGLAQAAQDKTRADAEKALLRTQLLAQFNAILQTEDTARGLIVNMSDVLFDTGKFSLRPLAREKLAKVAGIVSGHPGLRLDVEGYTDSVGTDEYNQKLSEQRGESVRVYLTEQGMASGSVSSKGLGKAQPVATNDTAEGRQENRRVELVISGEIIGSEIGSPIALR